MTDIARLSEALADRYAIERELGAGGMATVYLARDLKHDRQVALKVLKPELAAVLGADRFIVEIKTTASLQHPHILPLFDSGSADGFLYYVMPYIAGETIREKLNRETQFGVTEAVRIAREVADALDYAHRHGVIHRDIKPENILLHDGRAMVMDFGIALALSAAAGGRMTETGLSIGTPHYMSPEQATAEKELTPRSDVYSLASVLYEMLAGNPPHTGASAQQIIMKIIAEPVPPVTTLRKSVPPNAAAALAKALEKLPADRFESAKEFSDALANAAFTTTTAASGNLGVASARNAVSKQLFGAVAAVAVVAAAALAWMALRSRSDAVAAGVPMHFDLATVAARSDFEGGGGYGQTILLSPDGRTMVYRLFGLSSTQLMRRSMLQHDAVPLAGSANVQHHALSPDGKWVAFFVDSQLMKVRIEGGLPQKIATVSSRAISWGPNNVLVLGAQPRAGAQLGIGIVSAAGGPVREITRPDSARGEGAQRWPRVLADGKTVLYASWPVSGEKSRARIGIASLETGETTILDLPGSSPFGMFEGHLIYARPDGPIMAVPLDVGRRRVTGEPVVLVEDAIIGVGGASQASLSENGTLVYRSGVNAFRLVLVDARGGVRSMTPDLRPFRAPRFSPDGSKVAVWSYLGGSSSSQNGDSEGSESWVFDSGAGAWTKLPAAPSELHQGPEWTPDGKRILFPPGSRTDTSALFSVVADGSVAADRVATVNRYVGDVVLSRDGRTLVLGTGRAREKKEIWYRSLVGDTTPRLLLSGGYMPALSPDGKWLAYVADETGLPEVYVRAFPGPVSKWAVSTGGGTEPRWAPDGRHLYYRSPAKVMGAAVATTPSFAVIGREELFADAFVKGEVRRNYDVSPDGKNFLMLQRGDSSQKVMVFVNWFTEIRQKLAAAKR